MAIPVAAIGAIAGLASAGINAFMSARDRRRAERALAAMGPRQGLRVPSQIQAALEDTLKRSKMYQGFSQAELNQMRSAQARQNATMFNRAAGIGSSPMALQAIAANTDARNWANVAAQSAAMNRAGQSADYGRYLQMAGLAGQYDFAGQKDTLAYRDLVESNLGESIRTSRQNQADLISGMGLMGMQMAVEPSLWGSGSSNRMGSYGSGIGSTPGGFTSPGLLNRRSSIFQPLNL